MSAECTSGEEHMQVLFENLPVALDAVDCDGTEATILDCQTNPAALRSCDERTSSSMLACANSSLGACAEKNL